MGMDLAGVIALYEILKELKNEKENTRPTENFILF